MRVALKLPPIPVKPMVIPKRYRSGMVTSERWALVLSEERAKMRINVMTVEVNSITDKRVPSPRFNVSLSFFPPWRRASLFHRVEESSKPHTMANSTIPDLIFSHSADKAKYFKAFCVNPADDHCDLGLCPNTDVTGIGQQVSST
jgi:hypothetical protein